MKKIIFSFILFVSIPLFSYADEIQDVQCFFNKYIEAANNYRSDYFDYYSPDAKIIRVVEKPDGTKESVDIPLEIYKQEAKKSSKFARLRNYKNHYFNIKILPFGRDYKVVAMRMPSTSDYKIPAYFVIGKDNCGEWKIKEESMNTRVQRFLRNS